MGAWVHIPHTCVLHKSLLVMLLFVVWSKLTSEQQSCLPHFGQFPFHSCLCSSASFLGGESIPRILTFKEVPSVIGIVVVVVVVHSNLLLSLSFALVGPYEQVRTQMLPPPLFLRGEGEVTGSREEILLSAGCILSCLLLLLIGLVWFVCYN